MAGATRPFLSWAGIEGSVGKSGGEWDEEGGDLCVGDGGSDGGDAGKVFGKKLGSKLV